MKAEGGAFAFGETRPGEISSSRPLRPPYASVALLSAAALAYEILLMRLFAIVQWHHFAYLMISAALLGYGASGAFLALCGRRLEACFAQAFVGFASLFGVAAVACFALAQSVAFNPLELPWDATQTPRLGAIYLLLLLPFFCVATCVCLAFQRFGAAIPRLYSWDILGAGVGALAIVLALFAMSPVRALAAVGALGLAAAALAAGELRIGNWLLPLALAGAGGLVAALTPDWLALKPSPYKDLSQALAVKDARRVEERWSPLGLITVVESPTVPLRHAPGLSLNATTEPPPQLAVFTDGDGPAALTRFDGRLEPLAYLDGLTSALPYSLVAHPRVLVLGAGAGQDVLQALYHGASAVDAVELNWQIVDLVQQRFADFSGKPFSAPGVRVHVGEARGFVASTPDRYDLIQVALVDAFAASSAGLYALAESHLYTVEALQAYIARLAPGGVLAITRWVSLPPRDTLKLFATAAVALERSGIGDPRARLALIRGWKTATLIVKNAAFTADDIARLKQFCRARSFDVGYYPGMAESEANQYNLLERPYFFEGARALAGARRDEFIARYKFDLVPATDDRPYFFHFLKWQTLPELWRLKERGGMPLVEWGYPVLLATLAQSVLASLLLILLPLALRRGGLAAAPGVSRRRVAGYFLAVGFAFIFIEIAFIQKLTLFLAHPLYAVAVALSAFLLFAGLGSRLSPRLAEWCGERRAVALAVAAMVVLTAFYLAAIPALLPSLMRLSDGLRIALAAGFIAPLALAMGIPFPLALASVSQRAPSLVPWAWGVNGCASVVGAALATLLAMHLGFTAVVLAALALYALAVRLFP